MKFTTLCFCISVLFLACNKEQDQEQPMPTLEQVRYALDLQGLTDPGLSRDTLLTKSIVQLGKKLFFDPKLSKNNNISCGSCHKQAGGFSDEAVFSKGTHGELGKRQSMALFNLAWHRNGFFWDGRARTLKDQVLMPVQDHLEMDLDLNTLVQRLATDVEYDDYFIRAFSSKEANTDRIATALEKFLLTLISGNSRYDQFKKGKAQLTAQEMAGMELFFGEFDPFLNKKGGECFHCHGGLNFTNDLYMNNGLDAPANINDKGHFLVTNNPEHEGAFKVPSLRNIANTAPYMHDGRFKTLEEVVEHYNSGVKNGATTDELLHYNISHGLQLSKEQQDALVAFLKTLSDPDFLNNPNYQPE